MSDMIYIQKTQPKEADAIRINSEDDIPENLRSAIRIEQNEDGESVINMDCREGAETAPLGRIIRFEETEANDNCPNGINAWAISPESETTRFIERDGKIYQKPVPAPALPLGEDIPDWLDGAPIEQKRDGSFEITTDWGVSSGKPGEAYWVKYGDKADGTPDANILTKSEKSFDDYSLCTRDGVNICTLREFDDTYNLMRQKDPSVTPALAASQLFLQKKGGCEITTSTRGTEFDDILAADDVSVDDTSFDI